MNKKTAKSLKILKSSKSKAVARAKKCVQSCTACAPSKKGCVEITVTKKVLGNAPEQYHFILKDGRVLKNIQELADALETMNEDVFIHHVNDLKNDFATWINDIFDEQSLSEELRKTKSRIETRIKLLQKLVEEASKEGKRAVKTK